MNAPARIIPAIDSFTAWLVTAAGETVALDLFGAPTLEAAVNTAADQCQHKATFLIRHDDARTGKSMLRTYAVKQGKQVWRKAEDGTTRAVRPLYADLVCAVQVAAFEPVARWKWSPAADVVGIDRTLVEG